MTQAEIPRTGQAKHRSWKRLSLLTGILLILFWPELLFAFYIFQSPYGIYVFAEDQEGSGFMTVYLMIAHVIQLPLLLPLGLFWRGMRCGKTGLSRVGYGTLIPVAVAVGYFFFSRVHAWWLPGVFYAIGLLLLTPGLMGDSRHIANGEATGAQ